MEKRLSRPEKIIRTAVWAAAVLFCLVSAVIVAVRGNATQVLSCLGTVMLVCAPFVVSRIMKFEMQTWFFVFVELYALGPLLGSVYKLYYLTGFWDDVLHTVGGFVFAVAGAYLVVLINRREKCSLWLCAVFALVFSMAISVLWEFFEYGMDTFFHTDMQPDTFIGEIHSFLLGDRVGVIGSMEGIGEVVVNGEVLEGYIDIGLHDTMHDMLVETLGALVFSVYLLIDRDRHPILYAVYREEKELCVVGAQSD